MERKFKCFISRFTVCGKKVSMVPVKSQEMEEMEMMDRQFQSQMFMGMDHQDRMSNPWEDQGFHPRRGLVRGSRGGMMGQGRGGIMRGPARPDTDYLAYSGDRLNRSDPGFTGGFGRGRSGPSRGGRGANQRGSVKDRLGQTGEAAINPMFDDLYEQPQSTPVRQSTFERARHKVDTGTPGSYQGPQLGGPPQKTWSN